MAFPYERQAGDAGLAEFSASVLSLLVTSDEQRRRVARALRRYRAQGAARASWARLLAALPQLRSEASAAAAAAAEGAREREDVQGSSPAAPAEAGGAANGGGAVQRQGSQMGWLLRSPFSSAGAAEARDAAAVGEARGAGAGGGTHVRSPLKAASHTASAALRPGLSVALEAQLSGEQELEAAADPSAPPASPGPRPPLPPQAPRPPMISPFELPRQQSSDGSGRADPDGPPPSPLLSRVEALRQSSSAIPLVLFPDTPEGQLAQV